MSHTASNTRGREFLKGRFKYSKDPEIISSYLYYTCVYRSLDHPWIKTHYQTERYTNNGTRALQFLGSAAVAFVSDRMLFAGTLPSTRAHVLRTLMGIGVGSAFGFAIGSYFEHSPRDYMAQASFEALQLDKRTPLGDIAYHVRRSTSC